MSSPSPPTHTHARSGEWGAGQAVGPEFFDNHGDSGRYFWYGEHDIDTSLLQNGDFAVDRKGAIFSPTLPSLQGGLYACSTSDFVTWRNEGSMVGQHQAPSAWPSFVLRLTGRRPLLSNRVPLGPVLSAPWMLSVHSCTT